MTLEDASQLVLNGIENTSTRSMYRKALEDFLAHCREQFHSPLSQILVQSHKADLIDRRYSASSINQRLAAIRRLARKAADEGLLSPEHAAGILRMKGVKKTAVTSGKWLTTQQAEALMNAPDPRNKKGKRDRALLALLVGCGLRRSEVVRLNVDDLLKQGGRWHLVGVTGMHGKSRTVPLPRWARVALDRWISAAQIRAGAIFRALDSKGEPTNRNLSAPMILSIVSGYGKQIGMEIKPRDLRRTCARLCRGSGADLEQIQLFLGHSSIQITEQFLGRRENVSSPPNDGLGLRWRRAKKLAS
jgi:integrase